MAVGPNTMPDGAIPRFWETLALALPRGAGASSYRHRGRQTYIQADGQKTEGQTGRHTYIDRLVMYEMMRADMENTLIRLLDSFIDQWYRDNPLKQF